MSINFAPIAIGTGIAVAGGIAGSAIARSDGERGLSIPGFAVSTASLIGGIHLATRGQAAWGFALGAIGGLAGQMVGSRIGAALVEDDAPAPAPGPAPMPPAPPGPQVQLHDGRFQFVNPDPWSPQLDVGSPLAYAPAASSPVLAAPFGYPAP